jgi:hypothetical protein
MPESKRSPAPRRKCSHPALDPVVRKLMIDQLTVEIVGAFVAEGIETLVLKGPVLAEWLYAGEIRTYVDSDLMVAPKNWARAAQLLEQRQFRSWVLAPLSVDPGGTKFQRGDDDVDLHRTIPGLFGDPDAIWTSVYARADLCLIGGAQLHVPDRDTLLLHVALHAGHHANLEECKPFEDLRRAIAHADEQQWQHALALARAYDGVPAFATGLRVLPEGRDLVRRLGIKEIQTFRFALRREDDAIAEELSALFRPGIGARQKLATVLSELFPQPPYMRNWSSLARRGTLGLTAAYAWRLVWTMGQVPPAIVTLWRVRRKMGGREDA